MSDGKPEIIIDLPANTYQPVVTPPKVSNHNWLTLVFNSLLVCYSTALIIQTLSFIPLVLPSVVQLPKVAAVVIVGVGMWLGWQRRNGFYQPLSILVLSFAIGLLVGL
jgi:hypothetical protein